MAQPRIELKANGIEGVEIVRAEQVADGRVSLIKASAAVGILPYTVAIHNKSSDVITGLDIRYEIVTNGNAIVKNFFYGSPDDLTDSTTLPVIAPGQDAIICPVHAINQQLMNSRSISLPDRYTVRIAKVVEMMDNADRVEISIDSAIRADGVLRGPDRSGTFRKLQQQIWGYREFRDELLGRFSQGEPDATIITWLIEVRNAKVVRPGKNEPLNRSVLIRKLLAQEYLAYITQGRRQHAWETLKAATPEIKLRRIIKIRPEAVRP